SCLWSPSAYAGGSDSYALMREPNPDDLVLHVDNGRLVGWSRVAGPYQETTQGPPLPGRWAGRPSYYRIDLKDYREFSRPISVQDFIEQNRAAIEQELKTDEPNDIRSSFTVRIRWYGELRELTSHGVRRSFTS